MKLRATRRQLAPAQARVLLRDLRRRRHDAREARSRPCSRSAAEGHEVAPHLSCIGSTRDGLAEVIDEYREHGIRRIVALRGDLPSGMVDRGRVPLRLRAGRLHPRRRPATRSTSKSPPIPSTTRRRAAPQHDLRHFKAQGRRRRRLGDHAVLLQRRRLLPLRRRVPRRAGIDVPIVPGIMPITNFTQLARFSDACGAEIPRWMRLQARGLRRRRRLDHGLRSRRGDRPRATGCSPRGAPGLHFYTLNQAGPTSTIWQRLGL